MADPGTNLHKTHLQFPDHGGRFSNSCDSYEPTSFSSRARKTAQNYANYRSWNSMGARFRVEEKIEVDGDESGVCSPPLWKTSPSRSSENHYWSLSPTSRTQAIERGQRELMEMVRNMPESCYELSLKDIVEQQQPIIRQEILGEERNLNSSESTTQGVCKKAKEKKERERKATVIRSGSIGNGGLLIKVVFPISLRSKKSMKKNSSSVTNNSISKVSPKPQMSDGSGRGVDKEWWKKKSSVSGESESCRFSSNSGSTKSSGSSSRSSSSSSRRGTAFSPGCWPFFSIKKSKTSE